MSVVAAPPSSPFKGLSAFDDTELDALLFFGREREREVIVANLVATRLTLLYGESGVGKSSVLRAGVVRELRELEPDARVVLVGGWSADELPSFGELLEAGRAYLILDQFEEYFLYHGDDGALARELPELLRANPRLNVLISLREDALARLDAFKAGLPAVFANQLRLEHLDRGAARDAIVGPVGRWSELVGEPVEVEPELVEAVLDDVADVGAGGGRIEAPYLQLVLERLWRAERETGSSALRLETLRTLGGAATIVTDHLERALGVLPEDEKDVAASMFEHLVTPSGTKIAHRASDLADYAAVPADTARRVLGTLNRERILRTVDGVGDGRDRYEIFHDVLAEPVRAWRVERRLERERSAAARRHRRLLVFALAAAAALAVVAAVALFALAQRARARDQARHARAGELAATALADLAVDPARSLQLALSAARLERSPRVEDVLRTSLVASHLRLVLPGDGGITAAALSPDGRLAAVGSSGGTAALYDLRSARRLLRLQLGGPVSAVAFSPDGRRVLLAGGGRALLRPAAGAGPALVLRQPDVRDAAFGAGGALVATGGGDGTARLWRAADGRLLQRFRAGGAVTRVALSRDGTRLALVSLAAGGSSDAALYDTADGRLRRSYAGATTLAFSPDGRLLATGSADRTATIVSGSTGFFVRSLPHGGPVTSVEFSPDGSRLLTASADGAARIWSVAAGTRLLLLPTGSNPVENAHFSADGRFLATAGEDGTSRVWDAANGRELVALDGHRDAVLDATFSRDGSRLLTASSDGTARLWDTGLADQLRVVGRTAGPVVRVGFDGATVFAGAEHGLYRWRPPSRRPVESLPIVWPVVDAAAAGSELAAVGRDGSAMFTTGRGGARPFRISAPGARIAFSPDRRTLLVVGGDIVATAPVHGARATASPLPGRATDARFAPDGGFAVATANGRVALFSAPGKPLRVLRAGEAPLVAVAFSPDGTLVAAASRDGIARIWSARTGNLQHALRPALTPLTDVEFSPDGRFVATAAIGGDARLWLARDGRLVHVLHGHRGRVARVAFSPDSKWLLTAGPSSAGLWGTATGRLLLYLRGHTAQVEDVGFAPDGRHVVTGSDDATVRSYDCVVCGDVYELARLARARLSEAAALLTPAERRRYLGG